MQSILDRDIPLSPSFNRYSSGTLADIAARVVEELRAESGPEFDDAFGLLTDEKSNGAAQEREEDKEDDDFEFPSVFKEPMTATSADEIFSNGQIRPFFPIFGRDIDFAQVGTDRSEVNPSKTTPIRVSLRKLMNEEREITSCSSSEADDLDGVPQGTYCRWSPGASPTESPRRRRKSQSTGTSKRWRIRDLLFRSNSDGQDAFLFLSPHRANSKKDGIGENKIR